MEISIMLLKIDREIRENESLEKLISLHRKIDRLIFFPPKEDEEAPSFQIFCFDFHLALILGGLFKINIDYDEDEPGSLFDLLVYVEKKDFYEIINQHFDWNIFNLTDLEK